MILPQDSRVIQSSTTDFVHLEIPLSTGVEGKFVVIKFHMAESAVKWSVKNLLILACYQPGQEITTVPHTTTTTPGATTTAPSSTTTSPGTTTVVVQTTTTTERQTTTAAPTTTVEQTTVVPTSPPSKIVRFTQRARTLGAQSYHRKLSFILGALCFLEEEPFPIPVVCDVEPAVAKPEDITIYDDLMDMTGPRDCLQGSGTELEITRHTASLTLVLNSVSTPNIVEVRLSVSNVQSITLKLFQQAHDSNPKLEVL